jgi:hypothetical protein
MVTLTKGVISENSNMGLISKISARMKATNKTKNTQGSVRKINLHLMGKKKSKEIPMKYFHYTKINSI